MFTEIEASASQQVCHHGFLEAGSIKLDADDALCIVKRDLPDTIHFADGVKGAHGRLSQRSVIAVRNFQVSHRAFRGKAEALPQRIRKIRKEYPLDQFGLQACLFSL